MKGHAVEDEKESEKKSSVKAAKVLINLNGTIILVGLAVLGTGVFFKLGTSIVVGQVRPWIIRLLEEAYRTGLEAVRADKVDLASIIEQFGMPFIILGFYILVMSGTAICSTKLRLLPVLLPYCALLGMGMLVQLVFLVILSVKRQLLDSMLVPTLADSIREYRGYNETNTESQIWNIVMVTFRCCGATDFRDFQMASSWRRRLYQDGWWFDLATPLTCCHLTGKAPDDFSCAVNPSETTSYFLKGCYNEVWSMMGDYKIFGITLVVLLMLLQLVLFIASVIVIAQAVKARRERKLDNDESSAKAGSGKVTAPCSSRRSSDTDQGPFATAGIASLAQNLFKSFPGFSNPDLLNSYVNSCRRNTDAGEILSQLLTGSRQQPYYNNFNLPRYCDSQRGPVIVQLPSSPPLSGEPKYHNHRMIAIEGPEAHSNITEVDGSPRSRRQFNRCQSDGDLQLKAFENNDSIKLLRRDTYRY